MTSSQAAAILLRLDSATTSALIAAGAVLGGVIVGGLISLATTAYFERRRDKADIRQARRLVLEELRTAWTHADLLVTEGRYPKALPKSRQFLPTEQWEANRAMLARHLDDETWDALSPFLDALPTVRAVVEEAPLDSLIPALELVGFKSTRDLAAELYAFLSGGESVDATPEPPPRRRRWWRPWRR